MKQNSIKIWELSLLLSLCIALCVGVFQSGRQTALAEKVIRLHVIASGDSAGEQALKMEVKTAVERVLQPLMAGARSAEEAGHLIEQNREAILSAARQAADGEAVELVFGRQSYSTRHGEGYVLPAGEYTSLRLIIGQGQGHNWWGVIFPQLTPETEHWEEVALMDEEELQLIYESEEREISFRILEILQQLRQLFAK